MATKAELESKIAALEARLVIARECYRNNSKRIADLEAALNTRGVKHMPPAPVVTEFTRADGVRMQKIRTGNIAKYVELA